MILCEGNSFYTGYTKNLDSRIRLHRNGKGARYTRMHRPKKLVHVEAFPSRAEAMKREKKIKKMDHSQKRRLIKVRTQTTQHRRKRKARYDSEQM